MTSEEERDYNAKNHQAPAAQRRTINQSNTFITTHTHMDSSSQPDSRGMRELLEIAMRVLSRGQRPLRAPSPTSASLRRDGDIIHK